jgi:hypothetical protein
VGAVVINGCLGDSLRGRLGAEAAELIAAVGHQGKQTEDVGGEGVEGVEGVEGNIRVGRGEEGWEQDKGGDGPQREEGRSAASATRR